MLYFNTNRLKYFKPNFKVLPLNERLICGLGALLGLALSSWISWWILGEVNPWYIAPMGASSVILFALPSSPLAQPWNIILGNLLAAIIGVSCALYLSNLTIAFSLAVALSIIVMMSTDSLHPPSGAVAITAVLGGSEIHHLGYFFALYPVLLNSVLLTLIAIAFNRMVGRSYPAPWQFPVAKLAAQAKVSISAQDIQQVMDQQTQLLDISQYDLQNLILQAQALANTRLNHTYRCQDMMTYPVISLHAQDQLYIALQKFKKVNLMSLPVVVEQDRLVGTLALSDVLEAFQGDVGVKELWQKQVYQIMNYKVVTVSPQQRIEDLVPYFIERSFNYIPVVEQQRLVGIMSRADIISALYQQLKAAGHAASSDD